MSALHFLRFKGSSGALSGTSWLAVGLLVLMGSGMQGYTNETIDAFFVAILFLAAGFVGVGLLFRGGQAEHRAFVLTYAICVFVGGLAQCYALAVFGRSQSTIDAGNFFDMVSATPPFTTMANMPPSNAPLAVLIWQQVYRLTWWLHLDFGPYTAIMLNALVVGVTGSVTVRTAREVFGDDVWRLRRTGTLFAFCGMVVLFGAVLLRDCFTMFFNALVLWGLVRWLARSTWRNLATAIAITGVSVYAMFYLRVVTSVLFGVYWLLAFLFWLGRRQLDLTRLVGISAALLVLIIAGPFVASYVDTSLKFQSRGAENYAAMAAMESRENSLAMRLIVSQPLPVRLVLGTASFTIDPIPLWRGLHARAREYEVLKSYHGFYQVLVVPLALAGFLVAARDFRKARSMSIVLTYMAAYLLINMAVVAATSLETRHVGQFMPAFVILAAAPDTRDRRIFGIVKTVAVVWFIVVVLVHLAWAMARGGA